MAFSDSARLTAQKIIRGNMPATALVESCLAQIRQHNPAINAVVTLDEGSGAASR
ncbi:MAG: hypothetical protein LBE78_08695 [Burkholderiaceae bacterium]|jgi:amidase|nr:hypothetical protein [Burkholderiaceae bacterium]